MIICPISPSGRAEQAAGGRPWAWRRALSRRFPARIGCASSLRAWAPRRLSGASPSPPVGRVRLRPDRGWSRTGASAECRVAGSLGHRSWKRGCAPLPAPPDKGPSPGWISDPRLGSRPACRAGSRSGHDELSRAGAGARAAPAARWQEGHVPLPRGSRTWFASKRLPPTEEPPTPPPPPLLFFGRRSSRVRQLPRTLTDPGCNSLAATVVQNVNFLVFSPDDWAKDPRWRNWREETSWNVSSGGPWEFPSRVLRGLLREPGSAGLLSPPCVPTRPELLGNSESIPRKVETPSKVPLKIKKEKALLASLKMSLLQGLCHESAL